MVFELVGLVGMKLLERTDRVDDARHGLLDFVHTDIPVKFLHDLVECFGGKLLAGDVIGNHLRRHFTLASPGCRHHQFVCL